MDVTHGLLVILITFFVMEFNAWMLHKFVMHGFLWVLHEDHHVQGKHFLQKNDAFFLFFAVPSFLLMLFGSLAAYDFRFWIGLGILTYGLAYTAVHEIYIHRRAQIFGKGTHWYWRALRRAHMHHHNTLGKEGSYNFGMLIVKPKYYLEAIRNPTLY